MAMRRPRTSSRLTSRSNPGVAERDEDGGERGKQRKRKLSYMLGPPWSKDDLEHFYRAYRKYGKDWKKVAGSMVTRTVEMVEALYGVNKAYLSLAEGAASATGLIAMMTDHYSILEGSEEESSEEFGTSDRSHQTQSRLRTRGGNATITNSGPPSYGGPSPAKKPRSAGASRPRVVGKRTPRYPVGNVVEQKGKSKVVVNKTPQEETSDEDKDFSKAAEVVALTLVTASQRAASPLVSNTPTRRNSRTGHQNGHAREALLRVESGGSGPKQTASTSGEVGPEGSQESKEGPAKASSSATVDETDFIEGESRRATEGKSRLRKSLPKKLKLKKLEKYDDAKEECSQTGIQDKDSREAEEEKHMSGQKKKRHLSQRTKKRSRQLFSGDQNSALDALATLADLSLNGLLPSPTVDTDSAPRLFKEKEEDKSQKKKEFSPHRRGNGFIDRLAEEAELREENRKSAEEERKLEQSEKEENWAASGSGHQSTSPPESRKRKRKTTIEKLDLQGKSTTEEQSKNRAESQAVSTKAELPAGLKPRTKPKRIATTKSCSSQGLKLSKAGETSGLDSEIPGQPASNEEGSLPLKLRSKKKGVAEKGPVNGFGDVILGGLRAEIAKEAPHCPHTTAELGPFNMKARLIHCLSPKVQRWCMYEWFYSAIDLPWFAHNEFVEYLNHAGLGHVPRLTRVEWGVIRSSLGKPRRLSKRFLQEEREKLEKYRESVRTHYHELRGGLREGLPLDLARPLTVGQRVIARHRRTRQIHDGSILTVDRNRCRVQFDRPELGVEFVMDIDAMPIHPLENMPEVMRRKRIIVDSVGDRTLEDSKLEVKSRIGVSAGGAARAALNERLERPGSIPGVSAFSQFFLNTLTKRAQANSLDSVRLAKAATNEAVVATQQALITQPYTPGQSQARETDIRALVELGGALNKKEALVVELRRMNDEAAAHKGSEAFQRQYATIILQLKEVNEQVFDALKHLRHRNKFQDSAVPPWHRAASQTTTTQGGPSFSEGSAGGSLEAGPPVAEIWASAKKHARNMVSVAVKTMSDLKEGEDPLVKIGGALDTVIKGNSNSVPNSTSATVPSAQGLATAVIATSTSVASIQLVVESNGESDTTAGGGVRPNPPLAGDMLTPKTEDTVVEAANQGAQAPSMEGAVLSELMASCVATLLMVQTLTERQFSGPDVGLTLDNALESLRPQVAQNHCIFKDIEQQFGYIKTQILAQIPIKTGAPFTMDTPISQPNTS